jgi:Cu+-exporting ATPase
MINLPLPAFLTMGLANLFIQWVLTIPIIVVNYRYFSVGMKQLIKRDPNMDSLVAIGTGAALVYGVYISVLSLIGFINNDPMQTMMYMNQMYLESAGTILALVTMGKYLEEVSKQKTMGALEKLMDLTPKQALLITQSGEQEVDVSTLQVGDIVRIKPGGIIPVDGVIVQGSTAINQAAITGESIPVEKTINDPVIGATMNEWGRIDIRVSHVGDDTTLAKIIRLVEEAGQSKAPLAKLADAISRIFVPIVIIIATLSFFIWMILGQPFTFALQILIAILVISCPCALGLATPVAVMVGTGKGAEYGLLLKSAEAIEKLAKIDTVVLDKTGTLTMGHPRLTEIILEDQIDA